MMIMVSGSFWFFEILVDDSARVILSSLGFLKKHLFGFTGYMILNGLLALKRCDDTYFCGVDDLFFVVDRNV